MRNPADRGLLQTYNVQVTNQENSNTHLKLIALFLSFVVNRNRAVNEVPNTNKARWMVSPDSFSDNVSYNAVRKLIVITFFPRAIMPKAYWLWYIYRVQTKLGHIRILHKTCVLWLKTKWLLRVYINFSHSKILKIKHFFCFVTLRIIELIYFARYLK